MKLLLFPLIAILLCLQTLAQQTPSIFENKRNIVKVNLTSPIIKNYGVQYERVINKVVSVAISGRVMPTTTIPFKNYIQKRLIIEDDDLLSDAFDQAKFSNFAITPEVRFYLGKKGYGRGFYIAPYYRYSKYDAHEFKYTNLHDGEETIIDLKGSMSSHTGGFLLGAQWMLTNVVGLDWWILGPNIGGGKGNASGLSNKPIDPVDQADIKQQLEGDLDDVSFIKHEVFVDANGAKIKLTGPWGGVRAGVLLTFRF
ncbi:MAG TPA: DUF3575 domain-containing protein [Niabella sp.]|nr:DUF3575 domain-containing protein [Niabella sp.]HOZ97937.1 DUF3575 domain-containing protein [Niabella sp.]HQW15917.1 DUF3575 domain-containing protein [Niabella sp.]HQX21135.1 DUF3575 domain-containing protein [Niabella sp.]HQX40583.1 DUF3575 domain-containing protein [Niabella sp.]